MRRIKKFNESIERKDPKEVVDEILDSLSKKGKLSKSEKEFMDAASKDSIKDVSIPKLTGNFWADMSNPHNIGTLWIGEDGVWRRLMSIEDEEDEIINSISDYDKRRKEKMKLEEKRINEKLPNLKDLLLELAEEHIRHESKMSEISKKINLELKKLDKNSPEYYNIKGRLQHVYTNGYNLLDLFQNTIGDKLEFDEGSIRFKKN